jgi:phospho-N-acetylmuramoyl-pentapeptide-transferase
MLYRWLEDIIPLLRNITARAALAAVTAFLLCVVIGPAVIRWLRRKKIGEHAEIKDSQKLAELHATKAQTPTMGGAFLMVGILLSVAMWGRFSSAPERTSPDAAWEDPSGREVLLAAAADVAPAFHDRGPAAGGKAPAETQKRHVPPAALTGPYLRILTVITLAFALLGIADDYRKLTRPKSKGLSMFTKLVIQVLIGLGAGFWLYHHFSRPGVGFETYGTWLYLPFVKGPIIDLGLAYPFFVMLVIVSMTNAVNITDGLDGLAPGCLFICAFAFSVVAYIAGRWDFAEYLEMPNVINSGELAVFGAAVMGSCLGFLWFNCHPAQIFMGDSGSLPLGGALAMIALVTKQEFLLLLVGGVFVIEVGSDVLQIASFKLTGRRIFRIAPIHHHFQFLGLPETKIVVRFWIVAAILAVVGLASLKLR